MCLEPIMVAWTQKGALIGWGPSPMSISEPFTVIKIRTSDWLGLNHVPILTLSYGWEVKALVG